MNSLTARQARLNKPIVIAKNFASARYQFPIGLFTLARAEITVTGKMCTLKNSSWIFVRGEFLSGRRARRLTDGGEKVTCLTRRDL